MPDPNRIDRTTGEIDWPDHLARTPPGERERTSKFTVPIGETFDEIETELKRIGAVNYRLSTAAPHRKRDGRPYADANPDDPSVALRWTMPDPDRRDDQMADFAVGCDQYTGRNALRDNARELLLWLRGKRKMEGRPVKAGRSAFANAQLPPGDEDDAIVAEAAEPSLTDEEAAELMGLATPDVPEKVVRVSFEERVKSEHPDQGGDGGVTRLKRARDRLLDE